MSKCKNCKHMTYQNVVFNYTTTEYPYCPAFEECLDDIDKEIVCSGFEGITNADRIRSMTDEELAVFLFDFSDNSQPSGDMIYAWLKSKVWCE